MHERPYLKKIPSFQAQFIAQSIGQAFQVAYMEFLKANGIEDHSFVKEMDYQEVLNSQEIFGDELAMFAKKELQKEVNLFIIKSISMVSSRLHSPITLFRWWCPRLRGRSWGWLLWRVAGARCCPPSCWRISCPAVLPPDAVN